MVAAKLEQDVNILSVLEKILEPHDPRVLERPVDLDLRLKLQSETETERQRQKY